MQKPERVSEHFMVALFLRNEIASERFSEQILALLRKAGRDRTVIDEPDIGSDEENSFRLELLSGFRGYKQRQGLFEGFPEDVVWYRCRFGRLDLARVKYIDYSYWNELSSGSRLPADAATNIRAGCVVFGQSSERFLELARALKNGAKFPELILAGTSVDSELVVLDGHLRLTVYFLASETIPEDLPVVVGISPHMSEWMAI